MVSFSDVYSKLNEQQKKAVDTIYGPVMVVAGPWTGKTQIIWARTANIIKTGWVNPENILITTFTDAWVVAIKNRLLSFIWTDSYKVNVSTIHSFAQDVIATFPEKFIEYKAVSAIDEVDQIEIFIEIVDNLCEEQNLEHLSTVWDRYRNVSLMINKISTLKNEWVGIPDFEKSIEDQISIYEEELSEIKPTLKKYETTKEKQAKHIAKLKELSLIYSKYQAYLRQKELYDFNDMINFVLEKFRQDDELKYYYAEKFQFIMLDEYQDTNNAQNQIVDLILWITEDKSNIMVVWDDDQSIYRFQWANIENMLSFSLKYPETEYVVLETNYRSNQEILDLSNSLIKNNEERLSSRLSFINKELTAWNISIKAKTPEFITVKNDILEKDFVLNKIKELEASWEDLNEIAIIVRWNKEVKDWTDFIASNGFPVESKMKSNILDSEYVNFILDYLQIIENPYVSDEKVIKILTSKLTNVDNVSVLKLNKYLYEKNYSLRNKLKYFDVLTWEFFWKEVEIDDKEGLEKFRDKVLKLRSEKDSLSIVWFLNLFFNETGLLSYIQENASFDDLQDVFTFFNKAKKLNENNRELDLKALINKFELYKQNNLSIPRQILKTEKAWVNIMTAHGSKGLEYNSVFIPWVYEWNWSWKKKRELLKMPLNLAWNWILWKEHNQIEEDRRLFFVAITRAKENIFLTMPFAIEKSLKVMSVFVPEMEGQYNSDTYENSEISEDIVNVMLWNTREFWDKEFAYIEEFLKDYKLSPTDLNVFLEDPLEFLNRTVFRYPFTDNIHTIFGSAYHKALENLYFAYIQNWEFYSKDTLILDFKNILSKQILTPEEEEELLKKWEEWLSWYYEIALSNKRNVLKLEYNLRPKNISFDGIPLTWKIDKVERDAEGNLVLVDYKTWKKKSVNAIKWLTASSDGAYFRQLLFYKLMVSLDNEFASESKIVVAIDFCAGKDWEYLYVEIPYDDEEMLEFENELIWAWNKIKDIEYWKELLCDKN